jgi:phosphomethylpyrimidine synthase
MLQTIIPTPPESPTLRRCRLAPSLAAAKPTLWVRGPICGCRCGRCRYRRSGPYTDSDYQADVRRGLPALRHGWIVERGDTENYEGRSIRPEDNGRTRAGRRNLDEVFTGSTRRARRAVAGRIVTQLAYARRGEITAEMEFVGLREGVAPELVRDEVAAGRAVMPLNCNHPEADRW